MGVFGTGLYAGDFAMDLRSAIGAVLRLPFDPERLSEILCETEPGAARDPNDEDHTTFWLVTADQFAKRCIISVRVREQALSIIDSGADLDAVDPDGTTALSYAIINAQFDVAGLLLEKGANPNVPDSAGTTALYAAVDMHTLPWMFGRPDPIVRSKLTSLDVVKLALEHGANPNVRLKNPTIQRYHSAGDQALGEGATPFMRAAKAGDVAVMRLLLEHGARPGALLRNHTTALMIASGYGWRDKNAQTSRDRAPDADIIAAIQLCLDSGLDVNAFNDAGETPLHVAAARSLPIVKFLVEHGAKADMRDRRGRTPLDVTLAGPAPAADADAPVSKGFDPQVVEYLRQVTPGGARPAPTR